MAVSVKIASFMERRARSRFATTPGTRDVLPPESTHLVGLEGRVRGRFAAWGFREVITPALEYSEVIEEPRLRDASFKLFDADNQMLLLRPEMTSPIARLVAQRLRNSPPPHRLSYVLPVYRRTGVGRGQSAEFHQAGVEVVGSSSAAEDAGAIALLADVLSSVGLRREGEFAIVVGQSGFYAGWLRRAAPEAASEILSALADKDLARVDALAASLPDEAAAGAREIPRLVGPASDGELLQRAQKYALGEAEGALENLREILAHLEVHGCLDSVILDLGLIGRFGYYTGVVYEAYSPRLGFSVASGGRYDELLSRFGAPMPATGFAISLERLLSILPEREPDPLVVLVGSSTGATAAACTLRARGVAVLQLADEDPPEKAARYARAVEASWLAYPAGERVKLAPVSERGVGGFEELSPEEAAGRVSA
ncbi:MAG: ATP phosphoribosyltransferase regulatory subunit [Rubrobacteraceae bacterium]|nr:ATP phosphoribosyltransferase regulatory subunit [Rubrobacteraceae bacterium]